MIDIETKSHLKLEEMQTEAKTIKDEQEEEEREDGVVEEEKDTKIDQEMAPIDNSPQQQSTGSVNANSKKFRRLDRNKKRSGLRVPGEPDVIAKLERSRQSARECRARKKLRYQYLEDLVTKRENAVFLLRKELDSVIK